MAILMGNSFEGKVTKLVEFYRSKLNNKVCYSTCFQAVGCYSVEYSCLEQFEIFYVKRIVFCKNKNLNTVKIYIDTKDKDIKYIYIFFPSITYLKVMLNKIKVVEN